MLIQNIQRSWNSSFITQVNSVDDCFFISLNPHWQFKQKQLSTAKFELKGPCKANKKPLCPPAAACERMGASLERSDKVAVPRRGGSAISITKWSFFYQAVIFINFYRKMKKQGF